LSRAEVPVISIAIGPKTDADRAKLDRGLQHLMAEDRTFRVRAPRSDGDVVLEATGELHLEIILDRLRREFDVEASVGRPQILYKETLTQSADGEAKYFTHGDGRAHYGHVKLHLYPGAAETGYKFENRITGDSIPPMFIEFVEAGLAEARLGGVTTGYPVDDLRVELYDGSYHDVDSSGEAFAIAASMAFQDGAKKASPRLIEPVMHVTVTVPEEFLVEVVGNLSQRRGHIESREDHGGTWIVHARAPMSGMWGYATDLRARTRGRATYTMHFARYERVPDSPDILDDDRGSFVGVPRTPKPTDRDSRVALPEPDDGIEP
jgi:elongation factor G